MATDDEVRALFGRAAPWSDANCVYCGAHLTIVGVWHPAGEEGTAACKVYGCPSCQRTYNGGPP